MSSNQLPSLQGPEKSLSSRQVSITMAQVHTWVPECSRKITPANHLSANPLVCAWWHFYAYLEVPLKFRAWVHRCPHSYLGPQFLLCSWDAITCYRMCSQEVSSSNSVPPFMAFPHLPSFFLLCWSWVTPINPLHTVYPFFFLLDIQIFPD